MDILTIILGSSVVATIISKTFELLAARKKRSNGETKALQMLLLYEIKRQGASILNEGEITMNDLEAYNEMYKCYHSPVNEGGLGGNGFAEQIHKRVNSLPIKNE